MHRLLRVHAAIMTIPPAPVPLPKIIVFGYFKAFGMLMYLAKTTHVDPAFQP